MDFKSQFWLWIIVIGACLLFGGPAVIILSMFVAWLLPGILIVGAGFLLLAAFGHSLDHKKKK
jgi:hypothetical protein